MVQEEAEKGAVQDMASPANQVEDHPKSKEVANQHTTVPQGVKNSF